MVWRWLWHDAKRLDWPDSQESVNEVITQINNVLNYTVSQVGLAQNIGFNIDQEVNNFDISTLSKMNCTNATEIKEENITNLPP